MNIAEALEYGRVTLVDREDSNVDVNALLCYTLACQTTYLHTWPEKILTQKQQDNFQQLITQRLTGRPIAHLIGKRGFWSLDLKVTADTLIPRPDTELLVNLALAKMRPNMLVADLGTGSGAIALALAQDVPTANIVAIDFSQSALRVAKQNAAAYDLNNVNFWQGSWLSAIKDHSLDMVVSNPPYIRSDAPHLLQGDVRFEPLSALVSGQDGLDDIRQIIDESKRCLKESGWLLIEHGYHQAEQVQQLFRQAGFIKVSSQKDFGGNDRVVMGQV